MMLKLVNIHEILKTIPRHAVHCTDRSNKQGVKISPPPLSFLPFLLAADSRLHFLICYQYFVCVCVWSSFFIGIPIPTMSFS